MSEQSPDRKSIPGAERQGAYQYLPIECPNCGFQGKVKIERLNQTFHCKQCNQTFHVSRDGTIPGERPADAPSMDHAGPAKPDEAPWIERAFVQLPPAAKWVVAGVFVLLLALPVVWWMQPVEPLPGDIEDRAALTCKSLAAGDWKTIKRMAKKGTASELSKWYDRARPEDWEDVDRDTQVNIKVEGVTQKLKKYEGTHPVIDKYVRFTVHPSGKTEALEVVLIFNEDKESQWWLDGEQMLKESKPKKLKPSKKKGEEEESSAEGEE